MEKERGFDAERYTQLRRELEDLNRRIEEAPHWGAYVAELANRRKAVERALESL